MHILQARLHELLARDRVSRKDYKAWVNVQEQQSRAEVQAMPAQALVSANAGLLRRAEQWQSRVDDAASSTSVWSTKDPDNEYLCNHKSSTDETCMVSLSRRSLVDRHSQKIASKTTIKQVPNLQQDLASTISKVIIPLASQSFVCASDETIEYLDKKSAAVHAKLFCQRVVPHGQGVMTRLHQGKTPADARLDKLPDVFEQIFKRALNKRNRTPKRNGAGPSIGAEVNSTGASEQDDGDQGVFSAHMQGGASDDTTDSELTTVPAASFDVYTRLYCFDSATNAQTRLEAFALASPRITVWPATRSKR